MEVMKMWQAALIRKMETVSTITNLVDTRPSKAFIKPKNFHSMLVIHV